MSSEKKEIKHFIYVEALPEDAQHIENIRKFDADGLYFSPSENQFYRTMKNKKGEDKIKKIIPTKKGLVHCKSIDKKSICISTAKFRKDWMKEHPGVVVPPIPKTMTYSTPLDPAEEQEIFNDFQSAISELLKKHSSLHGRRDILSRQLDTTLDANASQCVGTHDALPDEMKERIQQDADEIELSDI